MQALNDYQSAARAAREADGQSVPLPSLQIYSDLPREWPMARLAPTSKLTASSVHSSGGG